MDVKANDIEAIVRQVLSSLKEGNATVPSLEAVPAAAAASAPKKAPAGVPAKARVAMLTKLEHFDLNEYPIPALGDDDILVKVEGCGVCGTDAHEFIRR